MRIFEEQRGQIKRSISYDTDPLIYSRCHSPMKVIAVIIDPAQVLKILMHLVKTERPPPGLDPTCLL